MSLVEYGDPCELYTSKLVIGKKQYTCCECCRIIEIGELHDRASGKCSGEFFTYRTCAHCSVVRSLMHIMHGTNEYFVFEQLKEEVWEEAKNNHDFRWYRLYVGMNKKWKKRDGSLMALPLSNKPWVSTDEIF